MGFNLFLKGNAADISEKWRKYRGNFWNVVPPNFKLDINTTTVLQQIQTLSILPLHLK